MQKDLIFSTGERLDQLCGARLNQEQQCYYPLHSEVPENILAFYGQWGIGADKWSDVLPHCLLVRRLTPGGIVVVTYIHGIAESWNLHIPRAHDFPGEIVGNKLTLLTIPFAHITYELEGGKLYGRFTRAEEKECTITLTKSFMPSPTFYSELEK